MNLEPFKPKPTRKPIVRLALLRTAVAVLALAGSLEAATVALKIARVNGQPVPGGPVQTIQAAAGSTVTVEAFLQGWGLELLRAYQVKIDPTGFTSGSAGSVAPLPGSAAVDSARPDFAFDGFDTNPEMQQAFAVIDTSSASIRWGAGLFASLDSVGDQGDAAYLATLDVLISSDASGMFTLALDASGTFLRNNADPPAAIVPINLASATVIVGGGGPCVDAFDCGDLNNDNKRDDPCLSYFCNGGNCSALPRGTGNGGQYGQADMGRPAGVGLCNPDGVADGNDRFHALNCFSNLNFGMAGPYPCESNTPQAINVDAGQSASCLLDGVCDGNDAFHALNSFANANFGLPGGYACTCSSPGPAPTAPPVEPEEYTGLALQAPKFVEPGDFVNVDVYLTGAVKALAGYELHLGVSGGAGGSLKLVDIAVSSDRDDYAYGGDGGGIATWSAFNRVIGQMVVGMDAIAGRTAQAGSYLATFTYRAAKDASGTFVIEVLHDEARSSLEHRTFLFGYFGRPIGVTLVTPARITVIERRIHDRVRHLSEQEQKQE